MFTLVACLRCTLAIMALSWNCSRSLSNHLVDAAAKHMASDVESWSAVSVCSISGGATKQISDLDNSEARLAFPLSMVV